MTAARRIPASDPAAFADGAVGGCPGLAAGPAAPVRPGGRMESVDPIGAEGGHMTHALTPPYRVTRDGEALAVPPGPADASGRWPIVRVGLEVGGRHVTVFARPQPAPAGGG